MLLFSLVVLLFSLVLLHLLLFALVVPLFALVLLLFSLALQWPSGTKQSSSSKEKECPSFLRVDQHLHLFL